MWRNTHTSPYMKTERKQALYTLFFLKTSNRWIVYIDIDCILFETTHTTNQYSIRVKAFSLWSDDR